MDYIQNKGCFDCCLGPRDNIQEELNDSLCLGGDMIHLQLVCQCPPC